ncbi:JAB domain-containing protein [uncultured Roseivirga sp.]|uniref:JAB domain-containing protein n=1 Tax=uncultured Roseivirga sp. TaxID=543088 RepID=UPI0030DB1866|tara:strand:+ start:992 stop:1459 length:468 start_codon:yes stop_codon:yes gene_type:complete
MSELQSKFEEVQLIYTNRKKASERVKISNSHDASEILKKAWDMSQIELLEECKLMLLDNSMRVMSIAPISKGGMTGTVVDARIIFAIALKRRAHRLILAHNHPTGNLQPSQADIKLTNSLSKAGSVLNIPLEDHLIITKSGSYSMRDHGDFECGV